MGWFGKIAFGSLGLVLGGPLGAVAGAALGHHLVDKQQNAALEQRPLGHREQRQAACFVCMFSILGKLAKADGVITGDEIAVVDNFIQGMKITHDEKTFARQVFTEAKASPYAIDDFAQQLYQMSGNEPALLVSFVDVLFQVAAADGRFHPAEEAALKKIKSIFAISDDQFSALQSRYFRDTDAYYRCLNANPESPDDEIKKNYKKLVKDFHPDTVIAKGLPEEFVSFATRRFQEIQEAYDIIKKERGM